MNGHRLAAFLFLAFGLLAGCARGAPLAFRWSAEVSRAEPFEAQAFHGETFALEATPLQYGKPLTGLAGAGAKLYWQTPGMEPTQWYTAPGAYDPATGALTATWTPAMDVGGDRVAFFLALTQGAAVAYRIYGRLRLAASPGFNPATLVPEDVRRELVEAITDEVKGWADAAYQPKGDYLTSEADPTVPAWAKAEAKPAYGVGEIGGLEAALAAKQDTLAFDTAPTQGSALPVTSGGLLTWANGRFLMVPTSGDNRTNNLQSAVRLINHNATEGQKPVFRIGSQNTNGGYNGPMREDRWLREDFWDRVRFLGSPGSEPVDYAFNPNEGEKVVARMKDVEGHAQTMATTSEAGHVLLSSPATDAQDVLLIGRRKDGALVAIKKPITDALAKKQDTLTFDAEPKENSANSVKSSGIWAWVKNLLASYLPLSGGTVTGNVTLNGADNYMERLRFGGTALAAGLQTRGISGSDASAKAKGALFLNYDGAEVPTEEYFGTGGEGRGVFVCGSNATTKNAQVLRKMDGDAFYAAKSHTHSQAQVTGLAAALAAKQDTLTAGEGIAIEGNVISATGGGSYELPAASRDALGGVRAPDGDSLLDVGTDGTLSLAIWAHQEITDRSVRHSVSMSSPGTGIEILKDSSAATLTLFGGDIEGECSIELPSKGYVDDAVAAAGIPDGLRATSEADGEMNLWLSPEDGGSLRFAPTRADGAPASISLLFMNRLTSAIGEGAWNDETDPLPFSRPLEAGDGIALENVELWGGLSDKTAVSLRPATASALGGVKVGSGLAVAADGTLSATPAAPQVAARGGLALLDGSEMLGTGLGLAPKRLSTSDGSLSPDAVTAGVEIVGEAANHLAVTPWDNGEIHMVRFEHKASWGYDYATYFTFVGDRRMQADGIYHLRCYSFGGKVYAEVLHREGE